MIRLRLIFGCLSWAVLLGASIASAAIFGPPAAARVEFYNNLLPEQPRGVGMPISDRKAWDALAKDNASAADIVAKAEKLLETPMPEMTDEAYLDYSRTGNRTRGQAVINERRGRLDVLTLAECFKNEGRYLPEIEKTIRGLCEEKSWLLPAHDARLDNFKRKTVQIDLAAANLGWQLATAKYWLGEKLSPEVRKLLADELERRIYAPFTGMVADGKPWKWWLVMPNNWNAVCLADVCGSALAGIESRERRAFFAASGEKFIKAFLSGFPPDGYCSEGIGYWNYGFGHYLMLSETIERATGGKAVWMADKRIEPIALFGRRIEILPGIYPSFADCVVHAKPDARFMEYLNRRYGWGRENSEQSAEAISTAVKGQLFEIGLFAFPKSYVQIGSTKINSAAGQSPAAAPRDWFSDGGVLICRPKSVEPHALGAALKGGHNAEQHNHNDLGSFVVALGKSTPLVDPGPEVYTARTFSSKRYESKVLSSFGHSVPLVAGQMQIAGAKARAKILKSEFTDAADTLAMDLSSAYPVESLEKLTRTFVFSREGAGKLMVADEVEFSRPENFGIALVTLEKWKQLGPTRLQIGEGDDSVQVSIAVEGGEIRLDPQEIKEDLPEHLVPVRIGVDLTQPAEKAKITVEITPYILGGGN
jgi:hypothetical protein